MEVLRADLRHALRVVRGAPAFSSAVILCLAFGIGASTTVFSWMEGLVLRPLPAVHDVERLVTIRWDAPPTGLVVSYPDYRDWRDRTQSLTGLAALNLHLFGVRTDPRSPSSAVLPVYGVFVTGNYFDVVGVRVARGRTFRAADESPASGTVAIVSYRFWQVYLAGAEDAIGREITVNGRPATIVGIVPPSFGGTHAGVSFDIWVPATRRVTLIPSERDRLEAREVRWLDLIGRLRPGSTITEATAEFAEIGRQSSRTFPENRGRSVRVQPLDIGSASQLTSLFASLVGITALVLLIVCSNIANLLVVRGTARRAEISLRLSLGATRARIIRQLMTENLLLAVAGAAVGVLLAAWGRGMITGIMPVTSVPLSFQTPLDIRVLTFVAVVTCSALLLFGLWPAIACAQVTLAGSLTGGGRGTRHPGFRLRAALVVTQVALCVVALVCTGLFLRRADYVRRLDTGFSDPARVLLLQTEMSLAGRGDLAAWQRTLDDIITRVRELPGVRAASLATFVPLGFVGYTAVDVQVEGYTPGDGESMRYLVNGVSPDYFATMGIPIRQGRPITAEDTSDRPDVAVVNEAFVRRFWKDQFPIGRRMTFDGRQLTVVGVAADGKYDYKQIDAPTPPLIYYAVRQSPSGFVTLHVRTAGNPSALIASVRGAVGAVDPLIPLLAPVTLKDYASLPMFPSQLGVAVLGVLSTAAVLLSAMGLYGLIAYSVAQRRRETGIRLALGAPPPQILGMFLREAVLLTAAGTVVGTGTSLVAATILRSQLPYLPAPDVTSLLAPCAVLALVGSIAGVVPARRAARMNAVELLKVE
jgi:predicted permease